MVSTFTRDNVDAGLDNASGGGCKRSGKDVGTLRPDHLLIAKLRRIVAAGPFKTVRGRPLGNVRFCSALY